MGVWLQLRQIHYVEKQGIQITLFPGDWWEFGSQEAAKLVGMGAAWQPSAEIKIPAGCGLMARGVVVGSYMDRVLEHVSERDHLPFPRTLFWDTSLRPRAELLGVGFRLLDNWQVAAPIWDYDQLAQHVGTPDDREKTKAVVRDLRVPVYDTRLIFFRRCLETQELYGRWLEERAGGGDEKLAFLRAVYLVKPLICALPASWGGK